MDIRRLQTNVFMKEDIFENMPISCNSSIFEPINLEEWRDAEGRPTFPVREETIEKASFEFLQDLVIENFRLSN